MQRVLIASLVGVLCCSAQARAQVMGAETAGSVQTNTAWWSYDTEDGGEGCPADSYSIFGGYWWDTAAYAKATTNNLILRARCADHVVDYGENWAFAEAWNTFIIANHANPTGTFTLHITATWHVNLRNACEGTLSLYTYTGPGPSWALKISDSVGSQSGQSSYSNSKTYVWTDYPSGQSLPVRLKLVLRAGGGGDDHSINAYNTADLIFSSPDPGVELVVAAEDGEDPIPLCPGDADEDGDTDVLDFGAFAAAFGAVPGAPGWNPLCDTDSNDTVDVLDFGIFAQAFGCGTE